MKLMLLVVALVGSLSWLMGHSPFGSTAASDNVQTLWYPSGGLQSRAEFEDGFREGAASEWYPNGQERCSGAYEHGLREGSWTFHTEAGAPDAERSGTYLAGVRSGP